jgi:secreted PhoX family phosphatase
MRFSVRLLLGITVVGAAVSLGTLGMAHSAESGQESPAADQQQSLVEDFAYPGADAIQTQDGVTLVSGDGHILFADCATPPVGGVGVIQVHSTDPIGANQDGTICFQVTGTAGTLTMTIPHVFEIRGDGQTAGAGHDLTADLTTDAGVRTTVDVNPSGSTPVGVGTGPTADATTLLTLTASS